MVTNNYTPYAGGVVRSIHTYTRELRRQGHTVYIITLDFGVKHDPWYVYRVPSCFRWYYRNNMLSIPWRAYRYVWQFITACDPDIIHVHSPFVLGNAGVYAARKLGIPVVFTYHSLYERFVSYVPVPQKITQHMVLQYVHAFCHTVHAVIAPSTCIARRIHDKCAQVPVQFVPTPIQSSFFQLSRREHGLHGYIISVGRFQPEKRLHRVIDAFAKLKHDIKTTLVLIGFGASYAYLCWYAYEYWRLSYDDVVFVIQPERHELLRWYQKADVFVSASPEAQGLVFAEAFAAGTPVVAFSGGGANDIVQHGLNGFLVYDANEMARCVCYLYCNVAQLHKMRRNAYITGSEYHPAIGTQRLVDCYRTVIKQYHVGSYTSPACY